MKKLFVCGLLAISTHPYAEPIKPAIAQPISCITSRFTAEGNQHWKNMILTLTNQCNKMVDFQNSTITFKNTAPLNTNFWGDFQPLPYPDNALNITSQPDSAGTFLSTLNLHFPTYPGATTHLPAGSSINIRYGVNNDTHIEGSALVYAATSVDTGSLLLKNATAKPANITQGYALIHLRMNGQTVKDVLLGWGATLNVTGLATGNYSIAPEAITDTNGNSWQGTANPASLTVSTGKQANSTVNYTQAVQTGKITVTLATMPQALTGYSGIPTVTVTHSQNGSAFSQKINWNTSSVFSQLTAGSVYRFSTPSISYNGYRCDPVFNPAILTASASAPETRLTFNCVQIERNTVTLNVNGAPATLGSLKINLLPNDGSATVSQTVNLRNGAGSNTVMLTEGVIYTVSTPEVPGYTVSFSPQPLTSTADAVETITLKSTADATPVALNGQLAVCGNQLCNAHGNPIQLRGMSTHGLQWYGKGVCVTSGSLDALANNFKANVIRLSLYVQEGGYETNPAAFTSQVSDLVNEAYARGIYVIIDWHILNPGNPNYNLARARQFFTDIATAHKDKNNILYEIANEPNGVSWADIKSYAENIIPVIRAIDPDAPIIVGTRGWSSLGLADGSNYQEIVNNKIQFPNIMYAFHFYAASHRDDYLNALDKASSVLPIFVSEFGTQTYSGDGANDFGMTDRYMSLMASKKIGWTNWNYSDNYQSSAIWVPNTCAQGAWTDSHLKPSGVYIKNKILNP